MSLNPWTSLLAILLLLLTVHLALTQNGKCMHVHNTRWGSTVLRVSSYQNRFEPCRRFEQMLWSSSGRKIEPPVTTIPERAIRSRSVWAGPSCLCVHTRFIEAGVLILVGQARRSRNRSNSCLSQSVHQALLNCSLPRQQRATEKVLDLLQTDS